MRKYLLTAALLVLGCGDTTGPNGQAPTARTNITGVWAGSFPAVQGPAIALAITLGHDTLTNQVRGAGTWEASPTVRYVIDVSGAFAAPAVSLTMTTAGRQPWNFTGTLSGTALNGTITESGVGGATYTSVVLAKR